MNKLLLTSFLFLAFLSSRSQTSVYHPFPTSATNATWSVLHDCYCWPYPYIYSTNFYGLSGDTIIAGKSYAKIYHCGYGWTNDTMFNPSTAIYNFAMREENKQIYMWDQYDSIERVHYDFNLALADSFYFYYSGELGWHYVTSVDSQLVNGSYRRTLHFDQGDTWIEGIGADAGLSESNMLIGNVYSRLLCYSEYGNTIYSSSSTCYISNVGIEETEELHSFYLFPNPAHDYFTINHTGELEIYNALGEKVYSQIVNRNSYIIHQNLAPGIYFVIVKDGEKIYRNKLIIN